MAVKVAVLHVVIHLALRDVVHLQVVPHLEIHQLCDALMVRNQPADPQAGGDGLGCRTRVDDPAIFVKALDGGHYGAVKRNEAIRAVLHHKGIVLLSQLHQLLPAFHRHAAAGGILEVGNGIDEGDVTGILLKNPLQLVHLHAVVIHLHAYDTGTAGTERIQCARIGGVFHNDHRAGCDQPSGQVGESLLGAAGDQDIFVVDSCYLVALHKLHKIFPQRVIPVGCGILDGLAALLVKNLIVDPADVLDGEELLAGQAAGKRGYLDAFRRFIANLRGDVPDGRRRQSVQKFTVDNHFNTLLLYLSVFPNYSLTSLSFTSLKTSASNSPSLFATMMVSTASPSTFSTVLNISGNLSMATMMPMTSRGKPTD